MATRTKTLKRGEGLQRHVEGYAIDCGKWIGRKGIATPKRFWLGGEEKAAAALADYIRTEWKMLRLNGAEVWSAHALRRIEMRKAGIDPTALEIVQAPSNNDNGAAVGHEEVAGKTLYQLFDEYQEVLRQRKEAKQISEEHVYGFRLRVMAIKPFLPDVPLAELGYSHLFAFAQKLSSRPTSKRGKPLAIATTKNYRQGLTEALSYAEDSGAWKPNCNWQRALRMKTSAMQTEEERDEVRKVDVFAEVTLRYVWNCATERERLYMLLALNCGFGQTEIATLKLKWVHLDVPVPYIERPRNKTRVPGRWPLWPETVALLRRHLAPNNKEANPNLYALLGEGGRPLVRLWQTIGGTHRREDAITHCWAMLRERVAAAYGSETTVPSFYALRRTGYSWIKQDRRYGTGVAEAYSQHKEKGMVVNYSDPVFAIVEEAVQMMHVDLIKEVIRDHPNPIIHRVLDPIDTSAQ